MPKDEIVKKIREKKTRANSINLSLKYENRITQQ
jgi:hypothetical protein